MPTTKTRDPQARFDSDTAEQKFRRLLAQWRTDTMFVSAVSELHSHPAYKAIVAMGAAALPFLIQELRAKPGMWIAALAEITGEDPVRGAHKPSFAEVVDAWIRWGKAHGY